MDDQLEKQKTAEWLSRCGYTCEPGANLVREGRNPDFFCFGPLEMWVEIKRLEEKAHERAFSPRNFEDGEFFLGGNACFTSSKNRSTSAVAYIVNGSAPLIVHNYWAHRKLPTGRLQGREIVSLDDGRFQVVAVP